MVYPLYLVNIEQEGSREALLTSYERAHSIQGLPAMVQTHAGPIGAALRQGDTALAGLKRLQADLHPNGLWSCGGNPCIESTLGMANIVQDMLHLLNQHPVGGSTVGEKAGGNWRWW